MDMVGIRSSMFEGGLIVVIIIASHVLVTFSFLIFVDYDNTVYVRVG